MSRDNQQFEDVLFAARNAAGVYFCEATHSQQYNPVSTIVNGITLALILASRLRIRAERIEIPGGVDTMLDVARHHMLEYDMMASSFDEHNKSFKVSYAQLELQKDLPSVATRYDGKYPKPVFDWVVGYLAVADWLVGSFKSDFGFPSLEKALLMQGLFLRKCDDLYETVVQLAGGTPLGKDVIANPSALPETAVISRDVCAQLVDICQKRDVVIGVLSLVYGWPGKHDAIFRSDAFVMAASMSAHFRYVYEGRGTERAGDNPFLGDCIKEKCRDFDKYAAGMMQVLQGHTITEGMRNLIKENILSLKYNHAERASETINTYGLLAIWAAKQIFPKDSLIQGESSQINIILEFAREFDKCYEKWKVLLPANA